jgi:hypothetical protein
MVALCPPGIDPDADHDHAHDRRDVAVQDLRRVDRRDRREERAAHQRPIRKDERRVGRRRDMRTEQQQGVAGQRAERRQEGEALARPAAADVGGVEATGQDVDQQPEEGHRAGEVGRDRLAAVAEANGLLAQPGLEADQQDGHDPQPEERATVAMIAPGEDRQAQDQDAQDRGDVTVDPFQPRLEVAEGGHDLAVAQRPVGAAQARIGGSHDDPDRDQQEGRRDRHRRELLKPGHLASAIVVDRGSTAGLVGVRTDRRARPF